MSVFSQSQQVWTGGGQWGYIIPHSEELVPIAKSNPTGMLFSYEKLILEKEPWSACNCFHYLGINFAYHDFQNPEILGQALTLYGSFDPILLIRDGWQISLKSGIGFSYLTRVFDEINNPQNTFFSSPISFLMSVSPTLRFRLTNHLSTYFSLNYNHISNGGQRQPNRGMNFPMLGIGLSYNPQAINYPSHVAEKPEKGAHFLFETLGTLRDNPNGNGRIGVFGLSMDVSYRFAQLNAIGGGLEANWDRSIAVNYEQGSFLSGAFISHHLIFGRFDFSQRMVLYLNKPDNYQPDRKFYQRYILNYHLFGNLKAGLGMKVHGHVAENIELRLGYSF